MTKDISLQLPIKLHVKLKMAADIDGRSLEAEIVELLEQALAGLEYNLDDDPAQAYLDDN